MERSRTETRSKLKNRQRKKTVRLLTVLAAAAVLSGAAGVYIWKAQGQGGGGGQAPGKEASATVQPASPSSTAGTASESAKTTMSPSPSPKASETPGNSPQAAVGGVGSTGPGTPEPVFGEKEGVRMAFVGDVLLASTVETVLKQKGYDYPYSQLKEYLQKPDITIANLEQPLTDKGTPDKNQIYTFRASAAVLPAFKEAGFDVVNLANNHMMDFGAVGLLDTLEHLDKAGIKRTGAGKNIEEAYKPAIVEANGTKVAFLGFSRKYPNASWKAGPGKPGTTQAYNHTEAVEAIKKTKQQADLVVAIAHWGEERKDKPEPYQRDLAKHFIDAGADLVIGGHPHVLQGFEKYKGKWIAYSLGNFIFTTNAHAPTWETIVLEAVCAKEKGCALKAVPVLTKDALPVRMNETDGAKLLERISGISFGAKVKSDGQLITK